MFECIQRYFAVYVKFCQCPVDIWLELCYGELLYWILLCKSFWLCKMEILGKTINGLPCPTSYNRISFKVIDYVFLWRFTILPTCSSYSPPSQKFMLEFLPLLAHTSWNKYWLQAILFMAEELGNFGNISVPKMKRFCRRPTGEQIQNATFRNGVVLYFKSIKFFNSFHSFLRNGLKIKKFYINI